jgi:hypothetical protein
MFRRPSPYVPPPYVPKWSPAVLQEGFTPFPKRLMRCLSEVFTGENAIPKLQVIFAIADAKRSPKDGIEYRPPTLGFLAYNVGMTEEQFEDYVWGLQTEGLVSVLDSDEKHFDVDLGPLLHKIEELTSDGS